MAKDKETPPSGGDNINELKATIAKLQEENNGLAAAADETIAQQQKQIDELLEFKRNAEDRIKGLQAERPVLQELPTLTVVPEGAECFFEKDTTVITGDYIVQLPGNPKKIVRGCESEEQAKLAYNNSLGISATSHTHTVGRQE